MPKPKKREVPKKRYITEDEIDIVDIDGKGIGVVASVDIPANSRLRYLGKKITEKTFENFERRDAKNPSKRYLAYIMSTGHAGISIDAHPRYHGSENWYASRLNEPSTGQYENMLMKYEHGWPVLVTTRKIEEGEELTFHYGDQYVRTIPPDYKKKYRAGRKVQRPWWWSKTDAN